MTPKPAPGLPIRVLNDKGRYRQHRETATSETFERRLLETNEAAPLAASSVCTDVRA